MNHYELLYIVSGKYAETEVKTVADQVDALIKKSSGNINFTQYWERRKLAYPIDHITHGHYLITEFDMAPKDISGLERQIRLALSEVIRHQIIKKDEVGKPVLPLQEDVRETSIPEPTVNKAIEEKKIEHPPVVEEEAPKKKVVVKKTEEIQEPAVVSPSTHEEEVAEEPKKKKKDDKVSFADLDKKLDEILNELP